MSTGPAKSALRTASFVALGAFAVHQLRYLAGYGDGAGTALGAQGHAYLAALLPVLVVTACAAVFATLVAVVMGARGDVASRAPRWVACTVALLAIFGVQEVAEGLLASGHPRGLDALVAHGGWIAVPLALVVGRILSWALGAMTVVESKLARGGRARRRRAPAILGDAQPPVARRLPCEPLAFGLARRPPPGLAA